MRNLFLFITVSSPTVVDDHEDEHNLLGNGEQIMHSPPKVTNTLAIREKLLSIVGDQGSKLVFYVTLY